MDDFNKPVTYHVVERTSPKGYPFIGRCIYCGINGLEMNGALLKCNAVRAKTVGESIIDAIEGKK